MKEQIKDTKKGLQKFLKERMQWFIDYGNPFQEATMVSYISRGLVKLNAIEVSEDTTIIMYDKDNELMFEVEA